MEITIQYIIIAAIFIAAIYYLIKRLLPGKSKAGGCSKGCSCGTPSALQDSVKH